MACGCGRGNRTSGTATSRAATKPAGDLYEVVNTVSGQIVLRTRDQRAAKVRIAKDSDNLRYRKAGATTWLP